MTFIFIFSGVSNALGFTESHCDSGSVDSDNVGAILALAEVNGALIGGASLKAEDFDAVIGFFCNA